ncbi:hypothetical protein DFJ74DRAFT_667904 [Hyaloraphidium curvatum]|nr:hypothetical protein DFJ74DRAFT_667904 [Hyaloraphidium curvatum]
MLVRTLAVLFVLWLLCTSPATAFCFYNVGPSSIVVFDGGRLNYDGDSACVSDGDVRNFFAEITPGGKACWNWSGFSPNPCTPETFYGMITWQQHVENLDSGTIKCVSKDQLYTINVRSGSGVTLNLDYNQTTEYPNQACA